MSITENIERIEQGKTSIISSIKSKGIIVPNDVLINEIAPYINEIQGGGVPTDTDTYNRLNFTNIDDTDGTLTIEDKVDISNMEYSMDSYTFSKVEERVFTFPKNATIYLKWEGDFNLDKNNQSPFFTTNIDTIVSGILRNGDIDREYNGLFNTVQNIKDVSNLIFRSEYLGEQSMASAFRGTEIIQTPTIEATKFGVACFDACYMNSSLQKATKFKVEECERDSFLFMYRECYNLHNIEIETNQWNVECFREWLSGSASEGYLYSNFENIPTDTESGLPTGWKRKAELPKADELVEHNKDTSDWDYITFIKLSGPEDTIIVDKSLTYVDRFEYSLDGGNTYYYANSDKIPLNSSTRVRWEGKLNQPYLRESWTYNPIFHVEHSEYEIKGELKHGNEPYNYACMFKNERWLRYASRLRLTADTVGESAYELLFYGCGNLQLPPQITATTVYSRGCCEIFHQCQSLQYAPELTATNISNYAYFQLFRNCSNINYVKIAITDWNPYATERWLEGVASEGTLETNATNIPIGSNGIPEGWVRIDISDEPELPEVAENEDILAIENVDEVEGTVYMNNPNNISIQYSTDGESFNEYTTASEIPINPSEKVYFKWSEVIGKYVMIGSKTIVSSSVKYKVYGELKQGNNEYAYYYMFKNESNLIDASKLNLSSTELGRGCYMGTFYRCSSLVQSPALPSTTLADFCYNLMFCKCSSLVEAPLLPATELQGSCYNSMFRDCTSLNYIKTNVVNWDTEKSSQWVMNVAPSGTFECPANSTIPINNYNGIPNGWTRVDF